MLRLTCDPELDRPPADDVLARLQAIGGAALRAHPAAGIVDAVLTDDDHLRRLNAAYRGKDRVTDVLSFCLQSPAGTPGPVADAPCHDEPAPAGEVYISLQRADAQADELGVTRDEELARLLVHGLLHLAGFDHQTESELVAMERETERILQPQAGTRPIQHSVQPPRAVSTR